MSRHRTRRSKQMAFIHCSTHRIAAPTLRTVVKPDIRVARVLHADNRGKRFKISHPGIFTRRITQDSTDQMSMAHR